MAYAYKMNFYAFYLDFIFDSFDRDRLYRILTPLGTAIGESRQIIADVEKIGDSDYYDLLVGDEPGIIENLLGVALVTCQTFITCLVSRVESFHCYYWKTNGIGLKTTNGEKSSIMKYGAKPVDTSGYTEIQVIDAFANYFKHRDEWKGQWAKLAGNAFRTATVIQAVGAQEGSTGNLQTAAEHLSNPTYSKFTG